MRAWVVRAGREGEREQAALDEGLAIAGWTGLGDLTDSRWRDDIRERVAAAYPDEGARVISNWTGQLYRFRHEIQVGDLLVLPLTSGNLAIGRADGGYAYRDSAPADLRHVRHIDWLVKDVPRAAVRQDLLDSLGSLLTVFELSRYNGAERIAELVSSGTDPGRPDADTFAAGLTSPAKLYDAVSKRSPGDPLKLSNRDFLSVWNAARRYSTVVDQIEQDLSLLGLTTTPAFTEGNLDSVITVLPLGDEPDRERTSAITRSGIQVEEEAEQQPVAYLVSNLDAANRPPESVRVGDSLQSAMTLMILRKYAQLPVLDEEDRLRGVVSWESIGRARMSNPSADLAEATAKAREADRSDDLLDWIGEIYQTGYVFVRDHDLKVCGLVTAADLALQFRARVRPFVLIEEIEQRLRRVVDAHIPLDAMRSVVKGRRPDSVHSAADLSFGAYKHLLKNDENWRRLGWAADRDLFLNWLEACRGFRNDVMHFSPDPLTDDQLAPVQGMLDLLRSLDPNS
ncbi:CBS domain-containing protein [Streptomyces cavernicola]|uniref:CBS domain-containing protein n=1 Tax=Streptomyces cavernicola TaxID=3043613 RepID=A0ABT6S2R1_9ACTN|nr:CBS domain-containing protein [Streptomyces sp. B-S-A6]MDI3402376.1 CBS domain-containing protein [Streptomyces sp. B-S-A6]